MSSQTGARLSGVEEAEKPADTPAVITRELEGVPQVINQRIARYFGLNAIRTQVGPGDVLDILPVSEEGELLGFIFDCNNPNMIIELVVSGDAGTSFNLNDLSVADMVSQGRGIGAGGAKNLPSGQAQDVTAFANNVFPYVSRYKNDSFPDFAGITDPRFTVMYTPSIPIHYRGLSVRVRNNDPSRSGTMISLILHRIVYVVEKKASPGRPRGITYVAKVGERYRIENP